MKKHLKEAAGFTLVELIVVIAILGILTAITVPTYSGYVKKANLAADQTLVESINTAFAAACLENQVNIGDVTIAQASIPVADDGTLDLTNATLVNDSVKASFTTYFGANASTAFKVVESLGFNPDTDMFEIREFKEYSYGGGKLYISPADAQKLGLSTFITNSQLGVDGLLAKVNDVTRLAAQMDSNAMALVLGSQGFQDAAMKALGVNTQGEMDAVFNELAAQMIQKDPSLTPAQAANQLRANAAVLYAAQNTTKMNASDITALLGEGNAKSKILANLNGTDDGAKGLALSQAAVAYGLYTSYAYSTGDQDLIDATGNPIAILNGLDDPDFQAYINGTQGKTDLDGYLSAMNMINSSTGDTNAVKELMVNGFADPNLADALEQSMGQ